MDPKDVADAEASVKAALQRKAQEEREKAVLATGNTTGQDPNGKQPGARKKSLETMIQRLSASNLTNVLESARAADAFLF